MSANLEGTTAATPAAPPASAPDTASLGGSQGGEPTAGTTAPASASEAWSRNMSQVQDQPAPAATTIPVPPEATATQPASTSPEIAAPTAEAAVTPPMPDPDADKYDALDPLQAKAEDFRGLRAHRKELVGKLRTLEPLAAKVTALGDPGVIDIVAPIFQDYDSDDARFEAGKTVVGQLLAYDSRQADALASGVYETYKGWIHQQALEDQGISAADLAAFKEFKASGSVASRTVYAPTGFPVADREGYVVLPDGTELNIGTATDPTTGDPTHKAMYGLAKKDWERDQAEATREATRTAAERATAEQRQAYEVNQRQLTWSNAEISAFETYVEANPVELPAEVNEAKETAELMTMGMFEYLIGEDADLRKWTAEGRELAGNGAARANVLAMNARQRTQDHYAKAKATVTGVFTELADLRKVVAGGRVQTAPRMPADSVPVDPSSQSHQPQQPPPPPSSTSQQGSDAYASIWAKNLAALPGS